MKFYSVFTLFLYNNTPFVAGKLVNTSSYLQLRMGLHNPLWQIDTGVRSSSFITQI